jgi:hypothetical protein
MNLSLNDRKLRKNETSELNFNFKIYLLFLKYQIDLYDYLCIFLLLKLTLNKVGKFLIYT